MTKVGDKWVPPPPTPSQNGPPIAWKYMYSPPIHTFNSCPSSGQVRSLCGSTSTLIYPGIHARNKHKNSPHTCVYLFSSTVPRVPKGLTYSFSGTVHAWHFGLTDWIITIRTPATRQLSPTRRSKTDSFRHSRTSSRFLQRRKSDPLGQKKPKWLRFNRPNYIIFTQLLDHRGADAYTNRSWIIFHHLVDFAHSSFLLSARRLLRFCGTSALGRGGDFRFASIASNAAALIDRKLFNPPVLHVHILCSWS